jgi:hypothetical protein
MEEAVISQYTEHYLLAGEADTDKVIIADVRNSPSRHVGIIDDKKLELINLEYLPYGFIYLCCI